MPDYSTGKCVDQVIKPFINLRPTITTFHSNHEDYLSKRLRNIQFTTTLYIDWTFEYEYRVMKKLQVMKQITYSG